jgi:hypothetical protein
MAANSDDPIAQKYSLKISKFYSTISFDKDTEFVLELDDMPKGSKIVNVINRGKIRLMEGTYLPFMDPQRGPSSHIIWNKYNESEYWRPPILIDVDYQVNGKPVKYTHILVFEMRLNPHVNSIEPYDDVDQYTCYRTFDKPHLLEVSGLSMTIYIDDEDHVYLPLQSDCQIYSVLKDETWAPSDPMKSYGYIDDGNIILYQSGSKVYQTNLFKDQGIRYGKYNPLIVLKVIMVELECAPPSDWKMDGQSKDNVDLLEMLLENIRERDRCMYGEGKIVSRYCNNEDEMKEKTLALNWSKSVIHPSEAEQIQYMLQIMYNNGQLELRDDSYKKFGVFESGSLTKT